VLTQQPLLRDDVVSDAHVGEVRHRDLCVRPCRIVWRGRQAVADLVDRDDEVALGVQGVIRSDVCVAEDLVCTRVPGGDQDGVVLRVVQFAEGGHGELAVRDGTALLQIQRSDADQVVLTVQLVAVERVLDHNALRRV